MCVCVCVCLCVLVCIHRTHACTRVLCVRICSFRVRHGLPCALLLHVCMYFNVSKKRSQGRASEKGARACVLLLLVASESDGVRRTEREGERRERERGRAERERASKRGARERERSERERKGQRERERESEPNRGRLAFSESLLTAARRFFLHVLFTPVPFNSV